MSEYTDQPADKIEVRGVSRRPRCSSIWVPASCCEILWNRQDEIAAHYRRHIDSHASTTACARSQEISTIPTREVLEAWPSTAAICFHERGHAALWFRPCRVRACSLWLEAHCSIPSVRWQQLVPFFNVRCILCGRRTPIAISSWLQLKPRSMDLLTRWSRLKQATYRSQQCHRWGRMAQRLPPKGWAGAYSDGWGARVVTESISLRCSDRGIIIA